MLDHGRYVRFFGMAAIFAGTFFAVRLWPSVRDGIGRMPAVARAVARGAVSEIPGRRSVGGAAGTSGSSDALRVLTFNLQNLFDTKDDPWTEDEEFLPLRVKRKLPFASTCGKQARDSCRTRNWTERALDLKLSRLTGALEEEMHSGPEVMIFTEVENAPVLRRMLDGYRPRAWKTVALIEGPDPRGIDAAVVSTYPLVTAPVLHLPGGSESRTRGILEVRLDAGCGRGRPNREWVVLAFHFPSQMGSARGRERMLDLLFRLIRERERAGFPVIAGGDSNMTMENQRDWNLRERAEAGGGDITHFLGCANCPGTYNYRGRWDFLDWIYFSRSVVPLVDHSSIRLLNAGPLQMDANGAPLRFTEGNGRGVSDHFPIAANLFDQCTDPQVSLR